MTCSSCSQIITNYPCNCGCSGCVPTPIPLPFSSNWCCPPVAPSLPCLTECVTEKFDATQVLYKTVCNSTSNLTNLNIGKGDNLEYIIENLAARIVALDSFNSGAILTLVQNNASQITLLAARINALELSVTNLTNDLAAKQLVIDSIKYPAIVDTRGLGFTNVSTINQVLQELSNN